MVVHLDGNWSDGDWNDRMAALQRAARMERSQVLRRLLLRLFCRRGGAVAEAWASAPSTAGRPALGEGR
jgi:hypothetical protein